VKHTTWSAGLSVSADGRGVVAHAGSVAVRLLADRVNAGPKLTVMMVVVVLSGSDSKTDGRRLVVFKWDLSARSVSPLIRSRVGGVTL